MLGPASIRPPEILGEFPAQAAALSPLATDGPLHFRPNAQIERDTPLPRLDMKNWARNELGAKSNRPADRLSLGQQAGIGSRQSTYYRFRARSELFLDQLLNTFFHNGLRYRNQR